MRLTVIILTCLCLLGCAKTQRSLYLVHTSISVGNAFPKEIHFPENADVTKKTDSTYVVHLSREWKFGRFVEHAAYEMDAAGVVRGKRYSMIHEEVQLLFLWQIGRYTSEWEVVLGPTEPIDGIRPICERLSAERPPLSLPPGVDEPFALLDAIATDSKVVEADFHFSRVADTKMFPMFEKTTWRALRIGDAALRMSLEKHSDYILPIHLPAAWLTLPFQEF